MSRCIYFVLLLAAAYGSSVSARAEEPSCEVRARTTSGWVCGARRWAARRHVYASFRGVPYAKQPVGELRFKELEPAESWSHLYDATEEGDICPQNDVFYGPLMKPRGMSEKCIFANIHVPIAALPGYNGRSVRDIKAPIAVAQEDKFANVTGLPILVFIHGGGFEFGSGDTDVHGPEQLVTKDIIVITFNYRLNVFGFLSLNSPKIPGNNGLRDMITLLRWVKDNAQFFGGNPDDVTLGGQSAGAIAASLLTLSPEAQGLFKRTIMMSGTALSNFYTTSPLYAQMIGNAFLAGLGINSTDPHEVHQKLVDMPLEKIMQMDKLLLEKNGLSVFFPVVESQFPGVKAVIPEDPETMLAKGNGRNIPVLIGFTNAECESFRKRFEEIDILTFIMKNPLVMAPLPVIFSVLPEVAFAKAKEVEQRYFGGAPSVDKYITTCSDMHFKYPALKLAKYRQKIGGAPTFLYQFEYDAFYSPVKEALGLNFKGAGHVEDLTNVFQVNSVSLPRYSVDDDIKNLMTEYVSNFMKYSHPTCFEDGAFSWPAIDSTNFQYQVINSSSVQPFVRSFVTEPTEEQNSMSAFFDSIRAS